MFVNPIKEDHKYVIYKQELYQPLIMCTKHSFHPALSFVVHYICLELHISVTDRLVALWVI